MAQRFGGKYSPGATPRGAEPATPPDPARNPFDGKRPARMGARINVLFVAVLALLWPGFAQGGGALPIAIGATALGLLSAWLTREGTRAHEAFDARRIARRPAFPRKMVGAVLMGMAVGLGAWLSNPSPVIAAAVGLVAAALHLAAFGPDPLRDKGAEGIDTFQTDRVARAVEEAEKLLAGMKDAILRANDRALEARVDRFATTARAMFRSIENDPGDLTAARKYLSVYLMGARDATVRFADVYGPSRDAKARAEYEALLTDLETNFAGRTKALISNDQAAMNIEIEVLRERLRQET
jgi:hypothetical protein